MENPDRSTVVAFSKNAVLRAIEVIQSHRTHEHLPGYLAVLRAKARNGGLSAKSTDINEVYDRYLRVEGAPADTPYLRAFRSRGKGLKLMNPNVAGSYAQSNRRGGSPFFEVVEVTGDGRNTEYDLKPDHPIRALDLLLQNVKLPITALSVFFYRDYGFMLESRTASAVVALFRAEFGLVMPGQSQNAFNTLFFDDAAAYSDTDLVDLDGV